MELGRIFSEEIFNRATIESRLVFVHITTLSSIYERHKREVILNDMQIQNLLETKFISTVVDKDDHPELYLFALDMLMLSGQFSEGALNLFFLPDKTPLLCLPSCNKEIFLKSIGCLASGYCNKRELLYKMAQEILEQIKETSSTKERDKISSIDRSVFKKYIELWHNQILKGTLFYTKEYYNPRAASLLTILKFITKYDDPELAENLEELLEFLQFSHLFDPINGGFFHSATDFLCTEPSFEKRLEENCYYLLLYAKSYKYYQKESFRESAERIQMMLLSDFKNNETDCFIRAISLDSKERNKNNYYSYSLNELINLFPDDYLEIAVALGFDISKNIFKKQLPIRNEISYKILNDHNLNILRERRNEHIGYLKDEREFIEDNAFAINALVQSSCITGIKIDSISNISRLYLLLLDKKELKLQESTLKLHDITQLIGVSITLFRYSDDENYLITAINLMTEAITLFYKPENGMFRNFEKNGLNIGEITTYNREYNTDFITPSTNSLISEYLLDLYSITNNSLYLEIAERQLKNMEQYILKSGPLMYNWAQLFELYNETISDGIK